MCGVGGTGVCNRRSTESFFPEMTGLGRHSHQIHWGGGESTWTLAV